MTAKDKKRKPRNFSETVSPEIADFLSLMPDIGYYEKETRRERPTEDRWR